MFAEARVKRKIASFVIVNLFSMSLKAEGLYDPSSFEHYLDRVNYQQDTLGYRFFTVFSMREDEKFRASCLSRLMTNPEGDFFYTLNPNGTYSEMKWFPTEKKAGCMKKYLATRKISEQISLPTNPVHMHMKLKEPIVRTRK